MKPVRNSKDDRLRALRALIGSEPARPAYALKADINVTPLVDVVLVLLIIFMVVTPLIASGVAVDLPRTAHHSRKPDDGKDIIISVTHEEHLYVGTRRVLRAEELARAVLEEKRRFPDKSVFLKGDARVPYGVVRRAMLALHESQVDDVVLATEERSNTP